MLRRRLMCLLLGASALIFGATPDMALASEAAAQSGGEIVVWIGHGTMAPGLTTAPTFQTSFTFNTDAVVYVGSVATGTGALCTFNGASTTAETLLAGSGAGTFTCSGGSPEQLNLTGHVNYTRTGETLTLSGWLAGPTSQPVCAVEASAVTLQPTSVPALFTAFRHQGSMVLACT